MEEEKKKKKKIVPATRPLVPVSKRGAGVE